MVFLCTYSYTEVDGHNGHGLIGWLCDKRSWRSVHNLSSQDSFLQYIASVVNPAVISVGYRLASKHLFPEHSEDDYDAAQRLFDNLKAPFGAPLKFAAGESVVPTSLCDPLFVS